jgi:iron complex outermembrane receptor protein
VRHAATAIGLVLAASTAGAQTRGALAELSLEELANLEVTSVSRLPESLADAPAAIYVITRDDIRRSGAVTLPEALRLAPNLHIAQIDSSQYAISARGFNNAIANKLLVLVDGRTIYTPLFSGVFWDQQDVLLEDIERIEVISGPGGTLWGANAVNGVINVITSSSRETQGALASVGVGTGRQAAAFRYGGSFGSDAAFRVYGKATHAEHTERANGTSALDDRRWLQAGFRADWGSVPNGVTLQGDAHGVRSEDRGSVAGFVLGRAELSGINVLGRWRRQLADGSDFQLQAYVDRARRDEAILFQPEATLFDVELQHGITRSAHRVLWGAGYRHGRDEVEDGILVGFRPTDSRLNWVNVYLQDNIRLREALELRAGIKLERNDYSGWEYLPSVRLGWTPAAGQLLWGAVSRAVRAPARLDRAVINPLGGGVLGGPDFESEVANVYQVGYRSQLAGVVTWSATGYLHDWDKLRSGSAPPVYIQNDIEGPVYGVESWTTWQVVRAWRVTGGVTAFRKDLRLDPGSTDIVGIRNPQLANDPDYQWSLRSSVTVRDRHEFDAMVRRVDNLPIIPVPAYTAVDARYGWGILDGFELSVVGQNLFDKRHPEFGAAPGRSEFERSVFVQARWSR